MALKQALYWPHTAYILSPCGWAGRLFVASLQDTAMSNPGNLSVCLLRNFLEAALPGAGYKHLHLHHYTCSPEWGARVLSWAVVQKPSVLSPRITCCHTLAFVDLLGTKGCLWIHCHFRWIIVRLNFFSCMYLPFCFLFCELSIWNSLPTFPQSFSYWLANMLYVLGTNILSIICMETTSFHQQAG